MYNLAVWMVLRLIFFPDLHLSSASMFELIHFRNTELASGAEGNTHGQTLFVSFTFSDESGFG